MYNEAEYSTNVDFCSICRYDHFLNYSGSVRDNALAGARDRSGEEVKAGLGRVSLLLLGLFSSCVSLFICYHLELLCDVAAQLA